MKMINGTQTNILIHNVYLFNAKRMGTMLKITFSKIMFLTTLLHQ